MSEKRCEMANECEYTDDPEKGFPKTSQPATRALYAAGYTHLNQLVNVSDDELLKLHGMGPKALWMLREALAKTGNESPER
jgi:hypothetical protein